MFKEFNFNRTAVIIGIAVALVTAITTVVSIAYLMDKKRKRESKELEDYLDNVIQ